MAIPVTTKIWDETLDPYDRVDFTVDCSGLLETGESISTYTVTPLAESTLAGLVVAASGYPTTLSGTTITVWLSVLDAKQSDLAFENGLTLPIEVSVVTNSTPARRRQRTVAVRVVQR